MFGVNQPQFVQENSAQSNALDEIRNRNFLDLMGGRICKVIKSVISPISEIFSSKLLDFNELKNSSRDQINRVFVNKSESQRNILFNMAQGKIPFSSEDKMSNILRLISLLSTQANWSDEDRTEFRIRAQGLGEEVIEKLGQRMRSDPLCPKPQLMNSYLNELIREIQ